MKGSLPSAILGIPVLRDSRRHLDLEPIPILSATGYRSQKKPLKGLDGWERFERAKDAGRKKKIETGGSRSVRLRAPFPL